MFILSMNKINYSNPTGRTFMRKLPTCLMLLCLITATLPCLAADDYKLGPDSQEQPGVPKGETTHYTWTSKVFPGTARDYWVYVPKQYEASKPACVMVFQDGGGFQSRTGGFRVPVVFDNLIARKEMPVTIAIMIDPGVLPALSPNALPRYNRSYEYDAPTDQYARFLLEEILPEVGKKYNLTQDANDRALCGASSGGICAFTTAWERPDQFSKVISFIGSFTNLRGGHLFPSLIRKMEPKPIRVYMQDGSNDQDIYSGSWFIGNNDVAAALRFGRYDYQYVVGDGSHSGRHGGAILPDALRWLWRDYPSPIRPSASTPQPVTEVITPGESWQLVSQSDEPIGGLAADASGNVYFSEPVNNRIQKICVDGRVSTFKENTGGVSGLAFAPDGSLTATQNGRRRIVRYDGTGREALVAGNASADHIIVNHVGVVYFTDRQRSRVWMVDKKGKKLSVDSGIAGAKGILLTPDQSLLLVGNASPGKFVTSFRIQPDGKLSDKQPYFDIHIPYGETDSGAGGMTADTQGRLYVASSTGIQVCDQAGRVTGIILNPDRQPTTEVIFGGPNLDELYVAAGGRVYKRKTKTKGVLSFQEPIKPPAPRL
jgi:gluconolactonase